MRLAQQFEQFIVSERYTTLKTLSHFFHVSENRCREELAELSCYGVEITADDQIIAHIDM